jgi:putative ABC transport system permease protein
MLKNYCLITLRNLLRNSVYSFINIAGLSVGMASSILILLWVADEFSFNRFHNSYDRLYKVNMNQHFSGIIRTMTQLPIPVKDEIRNRSGKVKHVVLTNYGEGNLLTVGDTKISKMGLAVTEDFLKMFSFRLIKGNPASALNDLSSIVLTASVAKDLFGDNDPLNQLVKIENYRELKVTGIVEDVPAQSTLQFDYLLPFAYFESAYPWVRSSINNWNNNGFHIYVELQPDALPSDVEAEIRNLVKDNNPKAPTAQLFLHPAAQWRLYSNFENGKASGGMIEYVQLFAAIGIFIMVIACINFMNLATARSESRAREVGIRKSVGSRRKELVAQFLGESIFITTIAFLFTLVIVEVMLPAYNILVDKKLVIDYSNPLLWLSAVGIVLITGLLSGSYPAFYLSSFQPVKVLKGKIIAGKDTATPRKILVIFQFGFSIFLIIGTLVIYEQIQHVKARQTGYDRENLMLIWTNTELENKFHTLREELKQTGVVKSVAKSSAPITRIFSSTTEITWAGKNPDDKTAFVTYATEYDFTETMGIKILEGRDFSPDFSGDSTNVIINQAAADLMAMKTPLGQKLKMWENEYTVVGVTENVIMGSPYDPVQPLVMFFSWDWSSTISVRLKETSDLPASIAKIEKVFKGIDPTHPLWYRFADSEFEAKFSSINLISRLSGIFAGLAIVISCLGLFGLAAFTAEQRTKEVGIRKVMGASVSSLVMLISKDFSKLVIVAFVLSAPVAWWLLNNFLEQYAYRTGISWWIIASAGGAALLLAVLIVSTQALRAAQNNPVDSLRSE